MISEETSAGSEEAGKETEKTAVENTTAANETPKNEAVEAESVEVEAKVETETETTEVKTVEEVVKTEVLPEAAEKAETTSPKTEEPVVEVVSTEKPAEENDIEEFSEEEETPEESFVSDDVDFSSFDKKEFAALAEKMALSLDKSGLRIPDVKNVDAVVNEINPLFEDIIAEEKRVAKEEYIKENGNEEGFYYKNDNHTIRYESALIQIKEKRKAFFAGLEARRENYFEAKTELIQKLREVVEREEKGASKENWEALKAIQEEWKNIGNMQSPHNSSLWSAYNALNDKFFDIKSIQNELKELDRKKNLEAKEKVVVVVEAMAQEIKVEGLTNASMKKANDLLNDYKIIGPGIRSEQELLWQRMKAAFDIIYDKKRELGEENQKLAEEIFGAKSLLLDKIKPFAEFKSESINEWNGTTKEVMEIQNQWNAIKGPMPKDKAKDTSKQFWGSLKMFFKNKSEFFNKLEAQREVNLKAKEELCQEAEALLEAGVVDAPATNGIIGLQKKWKTIGQVPRKHNDSIYKRFKAACDAFFEIKRAGNKEQLKEYEANLAEKVTLCEKIEGLAKESEVDLEKLKKFKEDFNKIGFVPRANIKEIQERFIKAINSFVKASSGLNKEEEAKLLIKNEVDVSINSGGSKSLQKQEYDLSRKAKGLEDEIAQLNNNIEFFGFSKGAEKMKAEYQLKIDKLQKDLNSILDKLKIIKSAS